MLAPKPDSLLSHSLRSETVHPNVNLSIPKLDLSSMSNTSHSMPMDGHWFDLPKVNSFMDLFIIGCSIAVIFGGLIPYIPQYLKIKRSNNSDGFSTYVCLTLLIANILRILFWFGHHFELPILIQSFVMTAGMLAMMEICIRTRDKRSMVSSIGASAGHRHRSSTMGKLDQGNESSPIFSVLSSTSSSSSDGLSTSSYQSTITQMVPSTSNHSNKAESRTDSTSSPEEGTQGRTLSPHGHCPTAIKSTWNRYNFWNWDSIYSYVQFLGLFTLSVSLLTYSLIDSYLYVETLGFVSVLVESLLGMPQLLKNYGKRSTRGMSVEMVIMWLSGDLFKTLYFILREAPLQFYVCSSIQVVIDILILIQVFWYRKPRVSYWKLPST